MAKNAYFCKYKISTKENTQNLHKKIMRKTYEYQETFGNVDISQIKIDYKSRDEIYKTVKGLQYLYINTEIRKEIFKVLEENILPKVSKKTGRPGMELWKILV